MADPKPPPFANANAVFTLVGSVVTAVVGIVPVVMQLTPVVQNYLAGQPANPNVVAFVSNDDALANSYVDLLSDPSLGLTGLTIFSLRLDELGKVLTERPSVVIFGSSNPEPPPIVLSQTVKTYLVTKAKVVGMGTFGANLFGLLESQSPLATESIKGIDTSDISLSQRVAPDMLFDVHGNSFPIFLGTGPTDDSSAWAIYDGGDLGGLGFRGIGMHPSTGAPCSGQLWPIVLRGNDLYWGFATDSSNLSTNGKQLFANLIAHLKSAPFDQPAEFGGYPGMGIYLDRSLTCDVPDNEYRMYPVQTGALDVSISATSNVLLTITGPNNQPVAEREGKKLQIRQQVSSVNYGDSWRVTVSYKTPPGNARKKVRYNLEMSYQPDGLVPLPDWVARSPVTPPTALWALAWLALVPLIWTGKLQALWSRRSRLAGWVNRLRRKS